MTSSLYRLRKWQMSMLSLMDLIKPKKMEFFCYIWTRDDQMRELKIVHTVLWVMDSFIPYNSFLIDEMLLASRYSIVIFIAIFQTNYIL